MRFILFLAFLLSVPVSAQEGGNIHWAMAAYFGTGAYKVSDNKEVYVIRPTPRWTIKEDAFDADTGKRTFGWRFKAPIAIGLHKFEFDDLPGIIDPDNLGSVSFVPGIEMSIPVTERWTLRPIANVGWGSLTDGSETAWSYWAGIKSRYQLPALGKMNWDLLNTISYVGYSPEKDKQEDMVPLMIGLDFSYPLSENLTLGGDALNFNWHATYTYYEKDMDFVVQRQTIESVKEAWEVGFSIAKQGKRIDFWRFSLDRIGLGFQESAAGVRGVKLYFRSVFEYL
jgi:hypothetical protein